EALRQLKPQHGSLQTRTETMYLDRLDGRINAAFFDEKSKEWRDEQKKIEERMSQLATIGLRSATDAVQMMKAASNACESFDQAEPGQQRALASALFQNATWKSGEFESGWKSPFDKMALSNSLSRMKEREKRGSGQEIEIWLPGMDSNHELDRILKSHNLLILQSHRSR